MRFHAACRTRKTRLMQGRKQTASPGGLLIIHPGALGDVVVMFGLMAQLRLTHGSITLICRESVGRLAADLNQVDRFLAMETAWWATLYNRSPDRRVLQLLADHDRIILFMVNPELEQIINARVSVPCLRVPPRPPAEERIHVTRFAAQALVEHGMLDQIPSLRRAACLGKTAAVLPAGKKHWPVLLHPGAGSSRKRWPLRAFTEVAAAIIAADGNAGLIIGPADRDLLDEAHASGLKIYSLNEMSELHELLSVAAGFIGNDSGVAHLAACMGLPTVVIFTASDPQRWRPCGPAVETLTPDLPCQPCFETLAANCPQPECLTAVAPDAVLQAFYRLHDKQVI